MPWRKEPVRVQPQIRLTHNPRSDDPLAHVTAIIGRNGTGKTHLLSSIVDTFIGLEQVQNGLQTDIKNMPLQNLIYKVGDDLCHLSRVHDGKCMASVNNRRVPLTDVPLPKRIVALTITPFDKFTVPRTAPYSVSPARPSRYRYLGLRDRTGKASIENLLFRSLNSLFETGENEAVRRVRLSRVFEFLGLEPRLTVVYKLRIAKEVMHAALAKRPLLEAIRDTSRLRRVREMLENEIVKEAQLWEAIDIVYSYNRLGFVRLTAEVQQNGQIDPNFLNLQPLRRAGFLQLNAVEVTQVNCPATDLKRASSGQLSMATALLSLASEIQDGSLVLIDEPELSLHPEWQVKYIELLLETFSSYSGCHFIIATHSPLVVSELPKQASLIALDNSDAPSSADVAGKSADFVLAELFDLIQGDNLHVRDLLAVALEQAAAGKGDTGDFRRSVDHLVRLTSKLPDRDGVRSLVIDLKRLADAGGKRMPNEPS